MADTVRRLWNICAKCYNRFLRGAPYCPACKSLEFSQVLAAVSEAEIEAAKEELLAKRQK